MRRRVLELGFGLGISASAIQDELRRQARSVVAADSTSACFHHVIVEANHTVAKSARVWREKQLGIWREAFPSQSLDVHIDVLDGFWEQVVPTLAAESFTGCLFDV